ncbi:hypothetical protein SDC9_146264 [bioreactor metagenome]|uniref:Uncharacterized protein n=1 Tax=bioreactor metagenome TaxID=1076179 RepID=A0A645EAL0_9ZZZZ
MRHRQNASGCPDSSLTDNHRTIVQRTVLKEYILQQSLVDIRIDHLARLQYLIERQVVFHDNECPHPLLAHTDASHNDGHNIVMFQRFFLVTGEKTYQSTSPLVRPQSKQKAAYLILKKNNERQHAYADQLVEYRSEQTHLQYLRHHQPNKNKHQNTGENIDGPRSLHQLVCVIQQESNKQYVYKIFYSKLKKHASVILCYS